MCLFPFALGHVWVDCRLYRDEACCVLVCSSAHRAAPKAMVRETQGSKGILEETPKLKLASSLLCWEPSGVVPCALSG